ncbi:uncharacterized protein LOC103717641 [Phoenix dactylifera]|uniref:Uncharacterized protein LOC103717641 n=1 Tax=Phoenix dactylifera TaxID=42345 RepID=A0A8B8ZM52_PHODC|nr:uncharacterized protein LOC103717641 [Phoenix dactylifera]
MDPDISSVLREINEKLGRLCTRADALEEYQDRGSPSLANNLRERNDHPPFDRNHQHINDYPRNRQNFDRNHNCPLDDYLRERPHHNERGRDPINQPLNDHRDIDDRILRSVRVEAPSFVGRMDPHEYLDWESDMNHYFEWYDMSEERKIRFAKMRLLGQAKYYWQNVERLILNRRQELIRTWDEMKDKLREKYLPTSYQQRLLDQWQTLTQGNKSVIDYIAKFDEFLMRCHVDEDPSVTLSRFRAGLRSDIQRELFMREVYSLEQAYQLAQDYERFPRMPITRPSEPRNSSILGPRPEPHQVPRTNPNPTPTTRPPLVTPPPRKEDRGKGTLNEGRKEGSSREDEEIHITDPELAEGFDEPNFTEETEPEVRINVLRCTLTQPKECEDWRRTTIFHTYISNGNKVCKIIIDSGSCINAVSTDTISKLGLTPIDHPSPYKVAWLDTSSIPVRYRCKIPIKFQSYQEEIWCDVLPMDVGSIILGRLWLFDQDAMLFGRTNTCSFMHKGKKITLYPSPPKKPKDSNPIKPKEEKQPKGLHLINAKELERDIKESPSVWVLAVKEVSLKETSLIPEEMTSLLKEFEDITPEDLSDQLPPMRNIQHAIDLVPGATLPNSPHYRLNPIEHAELKRQVEELLRKGFIIESLSPCAVPALLTPKKDGTWRMCIDSRAINKITIRYRFSILRLDDMLDMISRSNIFSKIDLKSGYHQVRIRPGDEWKTAFKTKDGLYECKTKEEHLDHLRQVFQTLRSESLFINLKICEFMTTCVTFLGFVVTPDGLSVDPEKGFSTIMAPITDCIRKGAFEWTKASNRAFEEIKTLMTSAPVLRLPDFSKVFEVACDASDSHRRTSDLAEGDYVMIRIRPERFPSGTVKNCMHEEQYKKPISIPSEPFEPNPSFESEPLPKCPRPKFSKKHDRIERILDEQIISTRRKGYQRYLVRWHGRPESDDTWITREELQQIDPDILEHYQSQTQLPSTELNFLQSGRIGGDTNEPASLWLDC